MAIVEPAMTAITCTEHQGGGAPDLLAAIPTSVRRQLMNRDILLFDAVARFCGRDPQRALDQLQQMADDPVQASLMPQRRDLLLRWIGVLTPLADCSSALRARLVTSTIAQTHAAGGGFVEMAERIGELLAANSALSGEDVESSPGVVRGRARSVG